MAEKRDLVATSVTLDRGLLDRLQAECGSVSAYLRAVLEGATWQLDRAIARVGRYEDLAPEDVERLDRVPRGAQTMGYLEALEVVVEAHKMGRHPSSEASHD